MGTACAFAGLLIALLICVPFSARAQEVATIQLLVTAAPGAPTPAQIVAYYGASKRSGPPPLQGLAGSSPLAANYLLPVRASGDFLAWLQVHPESARAKLENYVLVTSASGTDLTPVLAALRADPYVAAAYEPLPMQWSAAALIEFGIDAWEPANTGQYGRDDLNIDAAWRLAGGHALVGIVDTGLHEDHPALRQFVGSTYVGGNYIKAASLDIGRTGLPAPNADNASVDEARSVPVEAGPCTPSPATLPPANAGHGTHVAGLIAANGASGQGVQGTCKHCGITARKTHFAACSPLSGQVKLQPNDSATDRGITEAVDIGAQIINMSLGGQSIYHSVCLSFADIPACLALAYANARDVTMVASSGNDRRKLNFPAQDPRVIAVGGVDANLFAWCITPAAPLHLPGAAFLLAALLVAASAVVAWRATGAPLTAAGTDALLAEPPPADTDQRR